MLPASDLDGVDFKPFFDMVVGVIFVLLILIGALIFFEQTQQSESAAAAAQQLARDWQVQRADFLNWLAGHLRARGIDAQVDVTNSTLAVPLNAFASLGPNGLPDITEQPTDDLGGDLARDLACVTVTSTHPGVCSRFKLLRLNEAVADVQVGQPDASSALPPDRLANLLSDMLAAKLLKGSPDLLRLSASDGGMLMRLTGSVGSGTPAPAGTLAGQFGIRFDFLPP